jgi:hypothetical protein
MPKPDIDVSPAGSDFGFRVSDFSQNGPGSRPAIRTVRRPGNQPGYQAGPRVQRRISLRGHFRASSSGELHIDTIEFALHLRVGRHRGEVGVPSVTDGEHGQAGAMNEAFKEGELSFGRMGRKLVFILHLRKTIVEAVNASDYGRQEMSNGRVHMTGVFYSFATLSTRLREEFCRPFRA